MAKDYIGSKKRKTNHMSKQTISSGKFKSSKVPKNNLLRMDYTDQSK